MTDFGSPFDSEARKRKAESMFEESIEHISPSEISTAAELGEEKFRRLESEIPTTLAGVWKDLKLLIGMLRDYLRGTYRDVPFGSLAAVAAAVLYFASPIDAIPDFIPGLGYVDDAAVLMLCMKMVKKDIQAYRDWLHVASHDDAAQRPG